MPQGLHVLVQTKSGFLRSRGVSKGHAGQPTKVPRGSAGAGARVRGDCVVVSTLARAREHPFTRAGWDLVVIDECLSVQNDTALQSAAAWRQVCTLPILFCPKECPLACPPS